MKAIIERCAGIDVGKKFITACILIGAPDAEPTSEKRLFGTFTKDLDALRSWLVEHGCTHVVMESTGLASGAGGTACPVPDRRLGPSAKCSWDG